MVDMAQIGVLELMNQLKDAGAAIMPEVWHYIATSQIAPDVIVPADQAPSLQGA